MSVEGRFNLYNDNNPEYIYISMCLVGLVKVQCKLNLTFQQIFFFFDFDIHNHAPICAPNPFKCTDVCFHNSTKCD